MSSDLGGEQPQNGSSILKWTRPSDVPFPKVWHRFETPPAKNGVAYKIRIEDLTPDRHAEFRQLFYDVFLQDEIIAKTSRLRDDPPSVASYFKTMDMFLQQNVSVIAVIDEEAKQEPGSRAVNGGDDVYMSRENHGKARIVAGHLRSVASKNDDKLLGLKGEAFAKLERICTALCENHDPFDIFQTSEYIYPWGVCVDPAFRGLNIAQEVFANVETMARAFHVPACMVLLTAAGSQRVAQKNGFHVYNQLAYTDYKTEDGSVLLPMAPHDQHEVMQWAGKRYYDNTL